MPLAARGVPVKDPQNSRAPDTLQYASQVTGRLPSTGRYSIVDEAPSKGQGSFTPANEGAMDQLSNYVKTVGTDVLKTIPGIIPRAAAGLVGLPNTLGQLAEAGGKALGFTPARSFNDLPSWARPGDLVTKGYDELSNLIHGQPVYRPQTGPGRVADAVGQVVSSGPGSLAQKVVTSGTGALTAEAARGLGVTDPLTLGVLQMLGATAASLPFILRSVPAANINNAIKHVKPEQLQQAQQLINDAAQKGVKLTGAEAIAQVTGRNTLQDIQRVVESSAKGGPIIQQELNNRPAAVRTAFENESNNIGPLSARPSTTPVRLQQAAEGAITEARQAGNAAARPYYEKSGGQVIPSGTINTVAMQNPSIVEAANKVVESTKYGVFGENPFSVKALNAAKQYLDDIAGEAKAAGRNNEARLASQALSDILPRVDAQVPAYARARDIVAQNRRDVVTPMQQSPVGEIASSRGNPLNPNPAGDAMKKQSATLMPPTGGVLSPPEIRNTVKTLNQQDPTAARDWVRQNLQSHFDEITQDLIPGANQGGAAKFAAQVIGNPKQKDNLQALVESVSDRQTWNGFNRLLEVMQATGKRQAAGSQTQANLQTKGDLSAGGVGAAAASAISPSKIRQWYEDFRYGKNTEELARILTNPKSVELMRELAKEAPTSARASSLVASILALQAGANSAESSK
jgi:hypothetical protein